jgi:hypothetical protein
MNKLLICISALVIIAGLSNSLTAQPQYYNYAGFSSCYTNLSDSRNIWSVGECPFAYSSLNASVYQAGINVSTGPNSILQGTATIAAGQTTVKDFEMSPLATILQGYITNGCDNTPVVGARVNVGSTYTYSVANGYYYFQVFPPGVQILTVNKPGFISFTAVVSITSGGTTNFNVVLLCNADSPGTMNVTLNGTSTGVDISWLPPSGEYEIIYDDGGRENWTVWATAGNMNAVKFTPITGGVQVKSGKVHIGDAGNYPAGTDPTLLAPFQIAVYDATGSGGTPGAQIGDLIDVLPANFGWNTFTFPTPISLTGTFYLVMIQGGMPPNAVGLGIDETTIKLRSYSKFGAGQWLPASGNYMIRAVVYGQGGPLGPDAPVSTKITVTK